MSHTTDNRPATNPLFVCLVTLASCVIVGAVLYTRTMDQYERGHARGYADGHSKGVMDGLRHARDGTARIKERNGREWISWGRQTETSEN